MNCVQLAGETAGMIRLLPQETSLLSIQPLRPVYTCLVFALRIPRHPCKLLCTRAVGESRRTFGDLLKTVIKFCTHFAGWRRISPALITPDNIAGAFGIPDSKIPRISCELLPRRSVPTQRKCCWVIPICMYIYVYR